MTADDAYEQVVALYDEGRYAEAAGRARQALAESPDDGRIWQIYGATLCNQKEYGEAREALERASVLVPLHPLAQYALGACYARLGQPDLAAVMYEHLAGVVGNTRLLASLAARLGALDRTASALNVCRRIVSLDPMHHAAHFGIAYYLCRLGVEPRALIPHLTRAVELAPDALHYRVNLAFAQAESGCLEDAAGSLEPVSPEAVGCPMWLARMRDILHQAGRSERARACSERLVALNNQLDSTDFVRSEGERP
jgi:tetratricopeptide (TPR) repeat protein